MEVGTQLSVSSTKDYKPFTQDIARWSVLSRPWRKPLAPRREIGREISEAAT
jgi:hypothetical protein